MQAANAFVRLGESKGPSEAWLPADEVCIRIPNDCSNKWKIASSDRKALVYTCKERLDLVPFSKTLEVPGV